LAEAVVAATEAGVVVAVEVQLVVANTTTIIPHQSNLLTLVVLVLCWISDS